MNYKDFENLEDQIMKTVKTAVNALDFVNIRSEITDRAEDALGEVKFKIKEYNKKLEEKHKNLVYKDNRKYIAKNPKGKVSGILKIVFSSFGIAFFSLLLLGILITDIKGANEVILLIFDILFLGGNVILLFNGIDSLDRIKRFKKYVKFLDDDTFFLIKDLADFMHQKERTIIRDLRKMISLDMFLEGRIDEEEKYFLLNNEVYKNYLELKNRQLKEAQNKEKIKEEKKNPLKEEVIDEETSKVRAIIKEGREAISKIKDIESQIRKEEISIKLNKMQGTIHQILNQIEKEPKRINEVNKFINHYLPMTIKLLTAYKDLNSQSNQGENVVKAKTEIEHSIDVVNMAFDNLLDDLFEDLAMDISTDISVLKTLFKQEGLTDDNDFKN